MHQIQRGTEDKVNSRDQEYPSMFEKWLSEQWESVLMADGKQDGFHLSG